MSPLDINKKDCPSCLQQYRVPHGQHDAELPVELSCCGHVMGRWCAAIALLESSACPEGGHMCLKDYYI